MAIRDLPAHLAGPALAALACLAVSGCALGGGERKPSLSALPLVPGLHVSARELVCDKGSNAFCALELVLTGPAYPSSRALLADEHHLIDASGWRDINADTGYELAADSPGDKLRVIYATPFGDQLSVALTWIKRARPIRLALSHVLAARTPALSVVLEPGAG